MLPPMTSLSGPEDPTPTYLSSAPDYWMKILRLDRLCGATLASLSAPKRDRLDARLQSACSAVIARRSGFVISSICTLRASRLC
jgi:hypothetical protein